MTPEEDRYRPTAWRLHPDDVARIARSGRHCETRRCRRAVTTYVTRSFRRGGRLASTEHFVCSVHALDFSRRYRADIQPAPPGPQLAGREPAPARRAFMARLDTAAIESHVARGWHCDARRCREVATFYTSNPAPSGKGRIVARFLCASHAERFAARHHIDLAGVRLSEGGYQ